MASDTRNVKLGVCRITFDGQDLGYTKGGVEVEVATNTKKIMVDQFGESEIDERIMGRTCRVKVPLAETTAENMVKILPGATLVSQPGTKATGSFSFSANPANNDVINVNGMVWTFKTAATSVGEVTIGASLAATLTALAAALNASGDPRVRNATYVADTDALDVTYDVEHTEGNSFTLAETSSVVTVSGATLAGGVNAKKRVDVEHGIGLSLLNLARRLQLHPIGNAEDDLSEDFIIPLAMTGGGLQFAYKLDEERIFNCEFSAYPDPVTKKLFLVGDESAA